MPLLFTELNSCNMKLVIYKWHRALHVPTHFCPLRRNMCIQQAVSPSFLSLDPGHYQSAPLEDVT
jgi:hypothetical protein